MPAEAVNTSARESEESKLWHRAVDFHHACKEAGAGRDVSTRLVMDLAALLARARKDIDQLDNCAICKAHVDDHTRRLEKLEAIPKSTVSLGDGLRALEARAQRQGEHAAELERRLGELENSHSVFCLNPFSATPFLDGAARHGDLKMCGEESAGPRPRPAEPGPSPRAETPGLREGSLPAYVTLEWAVLAIVKLWQLKRERAHEALCHSLVGRACNCWYGEILSLIAAAGSRG